MDDTASAGTDGGAPSASVSLGGRVAVVTGAGGGIGRACAETLAAAGASVVCTDIDPAAADDAAGAVTSAGGTARAGVLDVTDRRSVEDLARWVHGELGRLDVWCNVAGTMHDSRLLDLDDIDFDRLIAVNLKGVLHGCQAAGRIMVEQGSGSIVNMSSSAVLAPAAGIGPYAITKAGVVQLTRTLAVELGRHGVRVNAVAPGFVPTAMTARYWRRPDGSLDDQARQAVLEPMARSSPLGRVGTPADVAGCVWYLASDASAFMTGQLLCPNGGVAMH